MNQQHILVVDDDPDTLVLVGMVLEERGFRVTYAGSGQEALEQARQDVPDLIILDVMMPDADGFSVAQRLRDEAATARVPILMFTARGRTDDRATGFEVGVDDYLTKPAHPAELLSRVKGALARSAGQFATGRVVACLGATPGAGLTTVAANTALSLAEGGGGRVVLAEFGPADGHLRVMAGPGGGLPRLLAAPPEELSAEAVEAALIPIAGGVHLLPGAESPQQAGELTPDLAAWLAEVLASPGGYVLLDLGSQLTPTGERLAALADRVLVVGEATRHSMLAAHELVQALAAGGVSPARMCVVVVHHRPAPRDFDREAVQEGLGVDQLAVIPAEPELVDAASAGGPLLVHRPESQAANRFRRLADELRERLD